VDSVDSFKRLQGNIIGESAIESLMLLLTKYKDINKVLQRCFDYGDSKNVDMTVEDIYGSEGELGIPK